MLKEKRRPGYIPPLDPAFISGIEHIEKSVAYGYQSKAQVLDIYYPSQEYPGQRPVIVYYHGGGFELGDKSDEDLEPMLRCLKRGYILVSAEYRKSSEAHFPAVIYDAKAVIRFLKANGNRYGMDTDRIGIWGPSSGGWIAGMLGTTADNPAFEDRTQGNSEYSSSIQAAVDWCGPCCSFLDMDAAAIAAGREIKRPHSSPDSPESRLMGMNISDIPELCRLAAPVSYVSPDSAPFLIIHGTADEAVPVEQSICFHQALLENIGQKRARIYLAEGKPHHGNIWYTEEWVSDMSLDFFDEMLHNK